MHVYQSGSHQRSKITRKDVIRDLFSEFSLPQSWEPVEHLHDAVAFVAHLPGRQSKIEDAHEVREAKTN